MAANSLNERELTAGTVAAKGAYYYLVMTWYETIPSDDGNTKAKKRTKWLPTRISVKEPRAKSKAADLLVLVRAAFDKRNPGVPIEELLTKEKDSIPSKSDKSTEPIPVPAAVIAEDKGILFSDYMLQWLEEMRPKIEITTFAAYQRIVNVKIVPYFKAKGIYLKDLTAQDIHLFYKDMRTQGLKAETVIRYHSNIRKALVDALEFNDMYGIDASILIRLKKPFKPEKEEFIPNFYSIDEANEMLKAFKGNRLELIVKLTAFYGFRREEVLGLKWSAVNFRVNTLTVAHTVTQCSVDGKSLIVYKDRAKNRSSRRTMPLVADLSETLIKHRESIERNKKIFGNRYITKFNEYICVDEIGDMIKPGYVTKYFKSTLIDNNLRKIRFHDLRHSCASLLLASGVPMKMIQEWLGHSNFSTTADRYSHLEHSQKVESANALEKLGLQMN
jgi:integrase